MKKYLLPLVLGSGIVMYNCEPDEIDGEFGDTFQVDTIRYEDPSDTLGLDSLGSDTLDIVDPSDTTSVKDSIIYTPVSRNDFLIDLEIKRFGLDIPLEYMLNIQTKEDSTVLLKNYPDANNYAILSKLFKEDTEINKRFFSSYFEAELFDNGYFKLEEKDSVLYVTLSNATVRTEDEERTVNHPLVVRRKEENLPSLFLTNSEGKYHLESELKYSIKEEGTGATYLSRFSSDEFQINKNGRLINPSNLEMKLKGTWKLE